MPHINESSRADGQWCRSALQIFDILSTLLSSQITKCFRSLMLTFPTVFLRADDHNAPLTLHIMNGLMLSIDRSINQPANQSSTALHIMNRLMLSIELLIYTFHSATQLSGQLAIDQRSLIHLIILQRLLFA